MLDQRIQITIDTTTPAFDDAPAGELARILRGLADAVEWDGWGPYEAIHDADGRHCGTLTVTDAPDA